MSLYSSLTASLIFFSLAVGSETAAQVSVKELKFLGEFDLPFKTEFKATTIGGLSGIDYDARHELYYLISDDRSEINPARFYTAKISLSARGIDSVHFVDVHPFLQANGEVYPAFNVDWHSNPDPEAIRYNASTGELVWTSEGLRIVLGNSNDVIQDPAVRIVTSSGKFVASVPIPANTKIHAEEKGTRQNGGFEGMTFTPDYKTLFFNVEVPLYEDGPLAAVEKNDPWIRIYQYDVATMKNTAQFAYHLDPIAFPSVPEKSFKINGVPDMLSLGGGKLLTIERSFSTGRLACTIKVFVADLSKASDIKDVESLLASPPSHPAQKRLVLNMDSLGIYTDNVEGVTLGPDLPNGHKTLVFVSDDNFQSFEKTQFLLFEIVPEY